MLPETCEPYEQIIYGTILYGDEFDPIKGYVCIDDGIITEVGEESTSSDNIIAPCFVNAHTHIGDSVCKDPPLGNSDGICVQRDLDQLVRPPQGLKHRILSSTPDHVLMQYMRASIMDMLSTGTCAFADFREGGVVGVMALKEVLKGACIDGLILGRPSSTEDMLEDILSEVDRVLRNGDGLGMSGADDMDMELLRQVAARARRWKRSFAIHAGEKVRTDIGDALSLEPDMLIHLTQADTADINAVADASVPVVVCPRSNLITGVGMPPVRRMLEADITVAVGTDNVMLNSVNMFSEMEFLSKVFGLDDRQVFKLCTLNGASTLRLDSVGSIKDNNRACLMILNGRSNNLMGVQDPLRGIVRRARPDDILSIIRPCNNI
ncbi:MAG: amidohydrolase family protein [Euryarchaeota archaeon]|nr:amidohydrolase family protein [Euryarchaeota archaeon]